LGGRVTDVAQSLAIAESCLYRWRSKDLVAQGLRSPTTASMESAALAEAERRIRELEAEVKILRKAAAAVEAVVPPKERLRLVGELVDDGVEVKRACHALGALRR